MDSIDVDRLDEKQRQPDEIEPTHQETHDSNMSKRQYTRRTDEQMIADLEDKISGLKNRIESKKRKDSPVVKKWKRVQKTLGAFAQLAMDHERADVANSVSAFVAGTNRLVDELPKAPKKPRVQQERVDVEILES